MTEAATKRHEPMYVVVPIDEALLDDAGVRKAARERATAHAEHMAHAAGLQLLEPLGEGEVRHQVATLDELPPLPCALLFVTRVGPALAP